MTVSVEIGSEPPLVGPSFKCEPNGFSPDNAYWDKSTGDGGRAEEVGRFISVNVGSLNALYFQ